MWGSVIVKKVAHIMIVITMISLLMGLVIYEGSSNGNSNVVEVKAEVLEVDDSNVVQSGISKIGDQELSIRIISGKHKGERIQAVNHLMGKLELDNFYKPGDTIIAGIMEEEGRIKAAKAIDLSRQNWEIVLFGVFVICLIVYAGFTGLKALLSFVASLYIIWKFLIPGLLNGQNPLILTSLVLLLLSAVIIFSVAGFNKKGLAAFIGTVSGLLITIGVTMFFGSKLGLHGMTSPYAETLLFSGHLDLNMKHIFYAAIIIGASGAAMDIAMDIAASMEEVKLKKPDISIKELTQSGFQVGRSVIGTMATTLLLAYSGGYLTLLMLFMSKHSSFTRIVNMKIIAAEIMRTVIGSIGLVLVAPITALVAGMIYSMKFKEAFKKDVRL